MLVVQAHYRSPLEVNSDTVADAAAALGRLDALQRRFSLVPKRPGDAEAEGEERRFVEAMDSDLDTPRATAGLFEAMRRSHALADQGDELAASALAHKVVELFSALGLEAQGAEILEASEQAMVDELVRRRDAARAARDFAAADALRDELESAGFAVEDTPAGTKVHRRTA
jgi:cysteinyl-tRNA synthetase